MNKLFKPRCLRRIFLCLALMFPIVYLCGGLFFALAGSHGNFAFDENIQENKPLVIRLNDFNLDTYPISFGVTGYTDRSCTYFFEAENNFNLSAEDLPTFSNQTELNFYKFNDDGSYDSRTRINNNILSVNGFDYTPTDFHKFCLEIYDPTLYPESFSNTSWTFKGTDFYKFTYSNSLSDYLFSQPFASNNFISSLGKDLVNGSNKGFAPMNSLFNFVNSNVFHFDASDNLAMFGFGYVYYAVNVLIVYEILVLAVKLIMLPLKAVDVFDKEDI